MIVNKLKKKALEAKQVEHRRFTRAVIPSFQILEKLTNPGQAETPMGNLKTPAWNHEVD